METRIKSHCDSLDDLTFQNSMITCGQVGTFYSSTHFYSNTMTLRYSGHGQIQREGQGVRTPLEKSQKYRVSWQYWSRSPEKSQSYQTCIQFLAIIGTPAKRHSMAFRWWANDDPLKVIFWSLPPFINYKMSELDPL